MFKRIYIEITNICNLNCTFCKGSKREKKFMDAASFAKVLTKIDGYTNYIYLHLLGEPLMHPELDKVLDLAHQHNMQVNLTTNGHLIEKKLDTINNAKSIRQMNISLHSFNDIDDIAKLLETIDKITIDCYISFRLWNLGVKNDNDKIIELLSEHYNIAIQNNGENVKLKDNVYLDFEHQFKWPNIDDEERSSRGTCYGLRSQLGILVDGTVVPCCLDTDGIINLGNIFEDDLDTILNKPRCKQIREGFLNRTLKESLCKRCHYITRFDKAKNNVK